MITVAVLLSNITTKQCLVLLFALLELVNVFQGFFRRDKFHIDQYGMPPSAFVAYNNEEQNESIRRLIDFFTVWMAGKGFLMCMLVVICNFSKDPMTRMLSCIAMCIGISTYFCQQASLFYEMEINHELVKVGQSYEITHLIALIILPLWILGAITEIKSYVYSSNEEKMMKIT